MIRLYFVLVSFATLMMLIFSAQSLLNLGLKTFVFHDADMNHSSVSCYNTTSEQCAEDQANAAKQVTAEKQTQAAQSLSMLLVSAPLFFIHFRIVSRDWRSEKKEEESPSKSV